MKFGTMVAFNDGEEDRVAFIASPEGGPMADLVILGKDGVEHKRDVPQRAKADYGPEGGGHTWHTV